MISMSAMVTLEMACALPVGMSCHEEPQALSKELEAASAGRQGAGGLEVCEVWSGAWNGAAVDLDGQ